MGFDVISYILSRKGKREAEQAKDEIESHKTASPLDHPDASVTDEKVASVSRDKVSDLFNAPFWDNIPDKPDKFPPAAHTHTRSDITDFFNAPFWDNIPDKPTIYTKLNVTVSKPSRSTNTQYTNDTSDMRIVIISAEISDNQSIICSVDGGIVAKLGSVGAISTTGTLYSTLTFVVPLGSTYEVDANGGANVDFWTEVDITLGN